MPHPVPSHGVEKIYMAWPGSSSLTLLLEFPEDSLSPAVGLRGWWVLAFHLEHPELTQECSRSALYSC